MCILPILGYLHPQGMVPGISDSQKPSTGP